MGTDIGQFDLYLWQRAIVLLIDRARSDAHLHGAMQLTLGVSGDVRMGMPDGGRHEAPAVLVAANQLHWFESDGPVAVVWLAPEGRVCRQLGARHLGETPIAALDPAPMGALRPQLQAVAERGLHGDALAGLLQTIEEAWLPGEGPTPPLHPAVKRAVRLIETSQTLRIGLPELAASVGVSESTLMHAFKRGLGMPVRRYLLWQRVRRAFQLLANERSATDAAHMAGFHDLPHMTRVFKQLLELTPGELVRLGSRMRVELLA